MANVQKVYTREFKEEAVRLAQTSGKSIVQVARELGSQIHPFTTGARSWLSTTKKPFQEADTKRRERRKIAAIPCELERVQQERDRLKKGVSIFSRDSK